MEPASSAIAAPAAWRAVLKGMPFEDALRHSSVAGLDGESRLLICQSEPSRFLPDLLAGVVSGATLLLADPRWPQDTQDHLADRFAPTHISTRDAGITGVPGASGRHPLQGGTIGAEEESGGQSGSRPGSILIPTGGTTGRMRFCIHTVDTLAASATGFCEHFASTADHHVCTLPLWHVSGLLQVIRAVISGGSVAFLDWRALQEKHLPEEWKGRIILSLVPTQLGALLGDVANQHEMPGTVETAIANLRRCRAIPLGGAPAPSTLLNAARALGLPLAPCYGMTETAAMVTAARPRDFLAGEAGAGRPLPHVSIRIMDAADATVSANTGEGRIAVAATSLCLGYYSPFTGEDSFLAPIPSVVADGLKLLLTNDRGLLDQRGRLSLHGRIDRIINTGGEKVDAAAVEAAILNLGLARDVLVLGMPDSKWGEKVVAVVCRCAFSASACASGGLRSRPAVIRDGDTPAEHRAKLRKELPAFAIPGRWTELEFLPRSAAGKPETAVVTGLLQA